MQCSNFQSKYFVFSKINFAVLDWGHRQTLLCTSFKLYHLVIITLGLFQMFQQFEHHCFKSFLRSYFYGRQFVTTHYFDQWNWIAHTGCKKLIAPADNANSGALSSKYLQVINHFDLPPSHWLLTLMVLLLVNNIECWELSVIGQVAMIQSYYWQEPQFATLPVHNGKLRGLRQTLINC